MNNAPEREAARGTLTRETRPVASVSDEPSPLLEPAFKRPLDLALSGIALLVSLPIWVAIAIAIWLEDGPPILFGQVRIGRYGRPIRILKFRSMVRDHGRTELQARQGDPRITRVGRFLRRFSLDELPQLWSIVRGDMSFVGPRAQPEREIVQWGGQEIEVMTRTVPGFELRQQVRPGLTGVAQLFAPREVPHRQKFRYDLIYVRRLVSHAALKRPDRWGSERDLIQIVRALGDELHLLWRDLSLIARAVWVALQGRWEV